MTKQKAFILSFVLLVALTLTVAPAFAQKGAEQAGVRGADRSRTDLAVLVDDSLRSDTSLQLADVKAFIRELPSTMRVAVAYSSNGAAYMAQDFTTDHERAALAVRMPRGTDDVNGIFDSLKDLQKRWPAEAGNRRVVLLISSGIDLLHGAADSQPGNNPDLQSTIDRYRRDGIVVYSIYASNASLVSRNSFLVLNGQGCLARLSNETGGEAYFSGSQTSVNFRPFLDRIRHELVE
jgi:hypothetical protein